MQKKKIKGECRLCRKITKLSFEHIPPKSLGNDKRVYVRKGVSKSVKTKKPIQYQRGYGGHTLCSECNSFFGKHYVPEANRFFKQISKLDIEKLPSKIQLNIKINPLLLFKYALTLFLSIDLVDNSKRSEQIRRFLKNTDSLALPSDTHIFPFICTGKFMRFSASNTTFHGLRNKNNSDDHITTAIGEASFQPLGFIMSTHANPYLLSMNNGIILFDSLRSIVRAMGHENISIILMMPVLELKSNIPIEFYYKK